MQTCGCPRSLAVCHCEPEVGKAWDSLPWLQLKSSTGSRSLLLDDNTDARAELAEPYIFIFLHTRFPSMSIRNITTKLYFEGLIIVCTYINCATDWKLHIHVNNPLKHLAAITSTSRLCPISFSRYVICNNCGLWHLVN